MLTNFICFDPHLAVVPIFVNAGAALLPAMVAGLASVAALIFKPKELLTLFRRKPYLPVLLIAAVVGSYFAWGFFTGHHETPVKSAVVTSVQSTTTDWAKVALEIIRQEERAKALGGVLPPLAPAAPTALPNEPVKNATALYYRGGPERSGFAGGASPTGLVPLWEHTEDGTMYLSSPLAVGDLIFGASCYLDPPGSVGTVFCLDAATGEKRWLTDTKDGKAEFKGFFSSPALTADGTSLVIGQGLHLDANAELVCLDAKTGAVRWLVKTPLHIEGSPAIEGDIAVAGAGAIEAGADHKPQGDPATTGNPGYVFGVRISDGKELWKYPLNDPEGSPAIAEGIVYIGSGMNGAAVAALRIAPDEELKAKNLDRLVWKTETPHPATGAVTLTGDLVLVGCGNGDFVFAAPKPQGLVIALEKATGKIRWKTELPDAVLGAIAVSGDKAIAPVRNGELVALDVATGRILWRQEDPAKRISNNAPILCGPAFAGTHIYAASQNGYLGVVDATSGAVLEKIYLNAKGKPGEMGLTFSSPFVAGGRVFVGSETGGLRAFIGKK